LAHVARGRAVDEGRRLTDVDLEGVVIEVCLRERDDIDVIKAKIAKTTAETLRSVE